MKEEIKNNLENPQQLEKLYRENKTTFRKAFDLVYPEIKNSLPAQIWNERLNFEQKEISWGAKNELLAVITKFFLAKAIGFA